MGGGWAPGLQALTNPPSLFPHPLPSSDYGGKAQRPLLGKRTLPGPLEACGRPFPRSVTQPRKVCVSFVGKVGGTQEEAQVPGQSKNSSWAESP